MLALRYSNQQIFLRGDEERCGILSFRTCMTLADMCEWEQGPNEMMSHLQYREKFLIARSLLCHYARCLSHL